MALKISTDNTVLEDVDHFPYLGSLQSSKATAGDKIHHRLSGANGAYLKLRERIFAMRDLQTKNKVLVHNAVLLSIPQKIRPQQTLKSTWSMSLPMHVKNPQD